MIDSTTGKRVSISTDGNAGPYIIIPVHQLEKVRALMKKHNISYSVDHNTISINGKPADSTINLGRGANVKSIQNLLDQIQ